MNRNNVNRLLNVRNQTNQNNNKKTRLIINTNNVSLKKRQHEMDLKYLESLKNHFNRKN